MNFAHYSAPSDREEFRAQKKGRSIFGSPTSSAAWSNFSIWNRVGWRIGSTLGRCGFTAPPSSRLREFRIAYGERAAKSIERCHRVAHIEWRRLLMVREIR